MSFKPYTMTDEGDMRFYQMPQAIMDNEKYDRLSHGAKLAYMILRDRQDLSRKNNWVDENGHIFLIYTNENMAKKLKVTEKTVITYKKELSDCELLQERRMGMGKPNRIYIGKASSDYMSRDVKSTAQTSNSYRSRDVTVTGHDITKGKGNHTEYNKTDYNKTNTSHIVEVEEEKPKKQFNKDYIIDTWNSLDNRISKVVSINYGTKRYNSLKARVEEYGEREVIKAIQSIDDSEFLKGNNDRGWKITFDWFVKPNNFIKVLEGNYIEEKEIDKEKANIIASQEMQAKIERLKSIL